MNVSEYKVLIENEFPKHVKTKSKTLEKSMLYSLNAGGKRLRPILFLEFFKSFNENIEHALPFAVAIEMIHTYSLIHDDMPCMDNDDLRRGNPTNHKVFGEDMALLAGDSLLNTAFEIVSEDSFVENFCKKPVLKAINLLSKCAGTQGMIYGQALDIQNDVKTIEDLYEIHENKTAKLLVASCVSGVILGGATEEDIKKVENFALNLGLAFQIKDDILDKYGDTQKLGKMINSDEKLNKKTFLDFKTLKECEELVEMHTNKALESISDMEHTDFIESLASSLVKREN